MITKVIEVGTFILAIVALIYTANTYNNAVKTYEATVDTSRKQLRAYVGLDNLQIELPSLHPGYKPYELRPGFVFPDRFLLTVKNSGTTPAKQTTVWINWQDTAYGYALPSDFPFADKEERTGGYQVVKSSPTVFGGQSFTYPVKLEDIRVFIEAKEKKKSLFFYGHIDYKDIYDNSHQTKFCYKYVPEAPVSLRIVPYDRYNDAD